jgi:hypothetical protein
MNNIIKSKDLQWYYDQIGEYRDILENITEDDRYLLLTLMDRTLWDFYHHTYDETYRLPYTGRT